MEHEMETSHWHGTIKEYSIGFIISLLLTLAAYFIVAKHLLEGWILFGTIVGLGGLQAIVQLLLFLHLGKETKPHWNLTVFLFMLMVLGIIVWGSLWIMYSLDERVMPNM